MLKLVPQIKAALEHVSNQLVTMQHRRFLHTAALTSVKDLCRRAQVVFARLAVPRLIQTNVCESQSSRGGSEMTYKSVITVREDAVARLSSPDEICEDPPP